MSDTIMVQLTDPQFHAESPTGRLRFVLRMTFNIEKGHWAQRVLQQEFRIITGNHKDRTERTEWRDVPLEVN